MSSAETERHSLLSRIYDINEKTFGTVALDVFRYQYYLNGLYRAYCHLIGKTIDSVNSVEEIPFLPIGMFREHEIQSGDWTPEKIFNSSGTTGALQSKHLVRDLSHYHQNSLKCFSASFGHPSEYVWLGLLPSYLERDDSSLIDMVHYFMHINRKPESNFFPEVDEKIVSVLNELGQRNQKTILIGVSFALLDLTERFQIPVWDNLIVIETGGMKGRGVELTREELHARLKEKHAAMNLFSEYGMTELLSQAYLSGDHFQTGPAMRVYMRDISDPLDLLGFEQRGAINVIDLANIDTCAFIATDDVGVVYANGNFDVLGRLDQSDIRGCNLLYV